MSKLINVLIIGESEIDAQFLINHIKQAGYKSKYTRVDSTTTFDKEIDNEELNIVISECNIPNFGGLSVLKAFKKWKLDIPIIFVSESVGEEYVVKLIKAGANDFILKSNNNYRYNL